MSKTSRYEWRDQQASLQERVKGFLLNPGTEQLEAVVAEMRAYADAAKSGHIEIPQKLDQLRLIADPAPWWRLLKVPPGLRPAAFFTATASFRDKVGTRCNFWPKNRQI